MANIESREVNLTKRVQTPRGMRYCPVVLSPNGRVKPDLVLINGKPEKHVEGAYYLEWREKGKRIRLSVGKDAQDAAARRQRKEAELNALNNGVSVLPENGNGRRSVSAAVAQFLEETELTKKPKTLAAYTTALNYFTESCRKLYLDEIERYVIEARPARRSQGAHRIASGVLAPQFQRSLIRGWRRVRFNAKPAEQ